MASTAEAMVFSKLFGPSRNEVWRQVAAEIGGHYRKGGWFTNADLRLRKGVWEIVLDTCTYENMTNTQMRAPFVNNYNLRFSVSRAGFFSTIGKVSRMQDIKIGDPTFDRDFLIKGNDENKIRRLLADERLKTLIKAQPGSFEISEDKRLFSDGFPIGVDQLLFRYPSDITDAYLLVDLFEMFTLTLEGLTRIDPTHGDDPCVRL